jgi:hypothetical protein
MKVPVGPSTVAVVVAALAAAVAFVAEWAQSGTAPVWLAGISGGLVAVLNVMRSYQAGLHTKFEPTDGTFEFVAGDIPDFPELDD